MDKEKVTAELKDLLAEVMPELGDVDFTKSITNEYGVNSISIIRLIVAIESRFKIAFTDYELDLGAYDTFNDLVSVIADKIDKLD
ncbi:MAG: acyl carrier protein [Eubacterium sp.]|nr:acyl carrier protein [Eubacterium sp.]MCR5292941.1 acyl carrier protein [Eubacterium sp.]